ncbi:MAG TPA: DUF411 domain-containing protein [Xanthomonadaceae bacterium]|nr:DUF411 domain-containing protein [Xanthomonadaceae bacterium]
MNICIRLLAVGIVLIAMSACARDSSPDDQSREGAPQAAQGSQVVVVHKTPWCGCCTAWAEQARAAGFAVDLRDTDDLGAIKQALGVPPHQASCHTAEVEGYFVEGHVPFDDIRRLLAERPRARGIAVPGMPLGSPGMEADVRHAYTVNLIGEDGSVIEYSRHPGDSR